MQELLLSDEFKRYRKAQINEIAKYISSMFVSNFNEHSSHEIKGALDMARKIIQLPTTFTLAQDMKQRIKAEIAEDFKEFETKFIRSHLIDE